MSSIGNRIFNFFLTGRPTSHWFLMIIVVIGLVGLVGFTSSLSACNYTWEGQPLPPPSPECEESWQYGGRSGRICELELRMDALEQRVSELEAK